MFSCIWYVSGKVPPWERTLIGNMASCLKARGVALSLYADGGTTDIDFDGVLSWNALTGFERMGKILFSGKNLWHLWGEAPSWWGLVRLHARTVHTSLAEKPVWQGHPSRLFPEQALQGEAVLVPSFDTRLPQTGDDERPPAVYASLKTMPPILEQILSGCKNNFVNLDETRLSSGSALSGAFIAGAGPSDAIRAAVLTMQGLVTAALKSPYLDALLGPDGYFSLEENTEDAWQQALEMALSEPGRRRAASARHFIKGRFSAERCADSLTAVYREAAGDRAAR